MASVYLRVTYTDGRQETVRVGPKAQVLFERHFRISMFDFGRARTMEQTFFLAWQGLQVAGKEPPEFDPDFLDLIEDITPVQDTPDNPADEEAVNPDEDPTQQAQPTDTSSS